MANFNPTVPSADYFDIPGFAKCQEGEDQRCETIKIEGRNHKKNPPVKTGGGIPLPWSRNSHLLSHTHWHRLASLYSVVCLRGITCPLQLCSKKTKNDRGRVDPKQRKNKKKQTGRGYPFFLFCCAASDPVLIFWNGQLTKSGAKKSLCIHDLNAKMHVFYL